ncbi:helix-turn-helix domain-containing protein [Vibrio vulnificus]|nr:helix-turn-helix domain-containing protein [Vibrio vulnificus]
MTLWTVSITLISKKLASQQKSIQMKMRLLALAHFKDGHSRTQITKFLNVSRTSVNKWLQTFLKEGLEGLALFPNSISVKNTPNMTNC